MSIKHEDRRRVVVIGAGVAGLTAAHELVERGFEVEVVEPAHDEEGNVLVGGLARSQWARVPVPETQRPPRLDNREGSHDPSAHHGKMQRATPVKRRPPSAFVLFDTEPGHDSSTPAKWQADRFAQLARTILNDWERWKKDPNDPKASELSLIVYSYFVGPSGEGEGAFSLKQAGVRAHKVVDELVFQLVNSLTVMLGGKLEGAEVERRVRKSINALAVPVERRPNRFSEGPLLPLVEIDLLADYLPAEHGFRFFPSFYRHLFDTMQRIPLQEYNSLLGCFTDSSRTVFNNLVPTERFRYGLPESTNPSEPKRSFSIRRYPPRSSQEVRSQLADLFDNLRYSPQDVARASSRFQVYLTSSIERRSRDYENMSWFDFAHVDRFGDKLLTSVRSAPLALSSVRGDECDARTMGSAGCQLLLDQFISTGYSDGTLNGPTSLAFLEPWQEYLESQNVTFTRGSLTGFEVVSGGAGRPLVQPRLKRQLNDDRTQTIGWEDADWWKGFSGTLARAEPETCDVRPADYYVIALPVERFQGLVTELKAHEKQQLQDALDAWYATPSPRFNRQSNAFQRMLNFPAKGEEARQSPTGAGALRHMVGIQFYFDYEPRWTKGHTFYIESEWGLTSISQTQFWIRRPRGPDSYRGVVSAILTIWDKEATVSAPPSDVRKRAWDCTSDELAWGVWMQIKDTFRVDPVTEPGPDRGNKQYVGDPIWYHLDENIRFNEGQSPEVGVLSNETPFLINRVGDWKGRPGWQCGVDGEANPKMEEQIADIEYDVVFGNLVFAGNMGKTHTRIGSMEAANESARHAVNAILDDFNSPMQRCRIFPMERLELPDLLPARDFDRRMLALGGEHPLDSSATETALRTAPWDLLHFLKSSEPDPEDNA